MNTKISTVEEAVLKVSEHGELQIYSQLSNSAASVYWWQRSSDETVEITTVNGNNLKVAYWGTDPVRQVIENAKALTEFHYEIFIRLGVRIFSVYDIVEVMKARSSSAVDLFKHNLPEKAFTWRDLESRFERWCILPELREYVYTLAYMPNSFAEKVKKALPNCRDISHIYRVFKALTTCREDIPLKLSAEATEVLDDFEDFHKYLIVHGAYRLKDFKSREDLLESIIVEIAKSHFDSGPTFERTFEPSPPGESVMTSDLNAVVLSKMADLREGTIPTYPDLVRKYSFWKKSAKCQIGVVIPKEIKDTIHRACAYPEQYDDSHLGEIIYALSDRLLRPGDCPEVGTIIQEVFDYTDYLLSYGSYRRAVFTSHKDLVTSLVIRLAEDDSEGVSHERLQDQLTELYQDLYSAVIVSKGHRSEILSHAIEIMIYISRNHSINRLYNKGPLVMDSPNYAREIVDLFLENNDPGTTELTLRNLVYRALTIVGPAALIYAVYR